MTCDSPPYIYNVVGIIIIYHRYYYTKPALIGQYYF
nr:MAG TPA: hypothetical protein [Caudoviricetes sp.]